MKSESAWNMFVFRDGRRTVPGATLARDLAEAIRVAAQGPPFAAEDQILDALLLAGEFECALTDAGHPAFLHVASITDSLAAALVNPDAISGRENLAALLNEIPPDPPSDLKISPPEGFAYYALHPLEFVDLVSRVPQSAATVGVIGVRSIGATLSALVQAAVRRTGRKAKRFTVRPTGHPYDRQTAFTPVQERSVRNLLASGAEFLVVDEGPGMSGSSFLSVGDALVQCGVAREKVTFLGSRCPDPDALRAPNGASRWRSYRSYHTQDNSRVPREAAIYVGGGDWRKYMNVDPQQWPASWIQMERLKFLSDDRRVLYKFEGLGRFGKAVYERSHQVATAGFAPRPLGIKDGFAAYPVLAGTPLSAAALTPELLDRMAVYCAFRFSDFRCRTGQDSAAIETMVRFNLAEEFGQELPLDSGTLHSEHPVLVDGRMLPHEWIRTDSHEYFKVDAASHGDDHFFPGPSDIAWDLAGAIVEWGMDKDATQSFLTRYNHASGDDPLPRIGAFLLAYTVFRFGYCKMAAGAVQGSGEEHRLLAAHQRYRSLAIQYCNELLEAEPVGATGITSLHAG
ncbi:MAG TPA: hypothetical protein VD837_09645 [Terriglobales bacterium]|nr:hypothetical protein [Terriglobales bacterium]